MHQTPKMTSAPADGDRVDPIEAAKAPAPERRDPVG